MSTELNVYGRAIIDGAEPVGCELHVVREVLDVSTNLPKPDPSWSMVDDAGHFHAYDQSADKRREWDNYPTLKRLTRHHDCDGSCGGVCGGEGYDSTYFTCRVCDVEIDPGVIPGPHYDTMPGLMSWECTVAANVPYQKAVSIRIVRDDIEWFGVAQAGGGFAIMADATPRSRLVGVSPLGRRSVKR